MEPLIPTPTSSLQQITMPPLYLPVDGVGSLPGGASVTAMAIHRRCRSIIIYSEATRSFQVCVKTHLEIDSAWEKSPEWRVPAKLSKSSLITCVAMEAMDCFVVVFLNKAETVVIFLGAINGEFLAASELSSTVLPRCADIDQKRRELFMGFTGGVVVSFNIRHAQETKSVANRQIGQKKVIQCLLRKQSKIEQPTSADGGNTEKITFQHIVTCDLIGCALVLSKEGSIFCVEAASHEVFWVIRKNMFRYHPSWLWADKFGTDFCVLCREAPDSEDDPGASARSISFRKAVNECLEYWKPPVDYASLQAGQFLRVAIPLTDQLIGLSMESLHSDLGVMVVTVTDDHHVQLLEYDEKKCCLSVQCAFTLSGGGIVPKPVRRASMNGAALNRTISETVPEVDGDDGGVGSSSKESKDGESEKQPPAFPPKFNGVSAFIPCSSSLPDGIANFLSSYEGRLCEVAVHVPSASDYSYQKTCLFVSASQLEAAMMPQEPYNENHVLDDFLLQRQADAARQEAEAKEIVQSEATAAGAVKVPSARVSSSSGDRRISMEQIERGISGRSSSKLDLQLFEGLSESGKEGFVFDETMTDTLHGSEAQFSTDDLMVAALRDVANDMESLTSADVRMLNPSPGGTIPGAEGEGEGEGGPPNNELETQSSMFSEWRAELQDSTSLASNPAFPLSFGADMDDDALPDKSTH